MIPAINGEEGNRGSRTTVRNFDLAKRGLRGNGTIRIEAKDVSTLIEYATNEDGKSDYVSGSFPMHSAIKPNTSEQTQGRLTGPVQFVVKLLDYWKLKPIDAVRLLGFDDVADADHVSAVLDGREQFRGRDVRDRIAHLFSIRATLRSLFRDLEVENDWLRESHEMLGGQAPLSLLLGGSIEDLLLVSEYVDAAAGR